MNWERTNIRDGCEALVGLIYPLAARKEISVQLDIADDLPLIETDLQKFQQIIFNFLSNAVKFTETPEQRGGVPGQITIRAERLRTEGEGAGQVRVSVIDTGPGISPDDHTKIFDKFQQLESGHTRGHAGTGLGLAICRELAGLLQGEIQVVSEVGRGSMFCLILPVEVDRTRAAEIALESRFRGALVSGAGTRASEHPRSDG